MKTINTFVFLTVVSIFFVFLAIGTIITSVPVFADTNDTVAVDVNVTEASSITVVPASLSWSNVNTGSAGGVQYLNIKNSGSINVTEIYAFVDTLESESTRPYGSSDPSNFSAGGVLALRNESDSEFKFAGRIEWNWTQDIPNHDWTSLGVTDPVAWGYFRNTSDDYVWVLGNGTGTSTFGCNDTGAEFAVEYDVDLGTTATRTPVTVGVADNNDADWSYFSVNDGSSPLDGYCVAAYYDCSKIYIYHYDKRTTPYNFFGCDDAGYLQEIDLTPGYSIILEVDAWVPNGYPSGDLNTTTLTVYASSA